MNSAAPGVGIMSPGDMGGATGALLRQNGLDVYTCLAGRSDLTRQIAAEAGFRDTASLDDFVQRVDIVLSILVPSQALNLARDVASAMQRTGAKPVYVDCNAIAPQTVEKIEEVLTTAGARVVDAGIIGGPPKQGSTTIFHCSGPDTAAFEELGRYGLNVNVVGPGIGQASGLKMVYAASTKGTTALWTELMTAARALGLQEQLMTQFGDNSVVEANLRGIPAMPHRAGRWVGEMEEIAATFQALGLTPRILEGAADMYRFVDSTALGQLTSRDPYPELDEVLETLSENLGE
jgi:3-hydroxyisobutyrate dehydrogenase-like beta-hydroxyacid dehydrogenase